MLIIDQDTFLNMNWTKALHMDVIPTFLKAGALKIRIFAERKSREIERKERSSNVDPKALGGINRLINNGTRAS